MAEPRAKAGRAAQAQAAQSRRARAPSTPSAARAMAERTEAKNAGGARGARAARGGRAPAVVTVGAVISALIAISILDRLARRRRGPRFGNDGIEQASRGAVPLVFAAGDPVRRDGLRDVGGALLGGARIPGADGDHHGRLVLTLIGASASCRRRSATSVLIAGAGAFFWFTVKALARIQMPPRRANRVS